MSEQTLFFDQIKDGGDINVILDPNLDGFGSKPKLKESVRQIGNICLLHDLVDIWRQKTPIIQRRLHFWLVDNAKQEEIDQVDIVPSIKSDHSAILLSINGREEQLHCWQLYSTSCRLGLQINKLFNEPTT